ncbi:DUF2637 domain-containing protein [Conyzicola sp.]|uniref:DUF2637 domain-containing protein n=1 Tax=Conyzicola sp. TaxID=1969404 RepID=UPI003989B69E
MSDVTLARTDGVRLAMNTAIVDTVFIAIGAFWLSFTSLTDLARRSGISSSQAWVWPLIVDGIIIVATVAAVALAGSRTAWYPWMLLGGGAAISVAANATHAIVADETDIPLLLAASVASVPPLVLLAITHLTSVLMRHVSSQAEQVASPALELTESTSVAVDVRQADASSLRALGWSNLAIAKRLGVHPSTVGRWLRERVVAPTTQTIEITEVGNDG